MTARSLLLLCSLALALPAQAQRRSVMEGLQAGNSAIFVSTPTAAVYVRTAGTMTVSGNAFSVGTSSFVVAGGSATVAYRMQAGSFLTTSSSTASAFFGDGSNLTNLPSASVAQSSKTYNLTGTTTATTNFDICYATGTITASGTRPVQVYYSGSITQAGASGRYCVISFMQDGAHIAPYTRTVGMGAGVTSSAGGFGTATNVRVFPAPSAGSHAWCISMISPFGDACTFTFASAHGNEFGVTEL